MRANHGQRQPKVLYINLLESCPFDGFPGFPIGPATISQTFPEWLDPSLDRSHESAFGSGYVLDEQEPASGFEDPPYFPEHLLLIIPACLLQCPCFRPPAEYSLPFH